MIRLNVQNHGRFEMRIENLPKDILQYSIYKELDHDSLRALSKVNKAFYKQIISYRLSNTSMSEQFPLYPHIRRDMTRKKQYIINWLTYRFTRYQGTKDFPTLFSRVKLRSLLNTTDNIEIAILSLGASLIVSSDNTSRTTIINQLSLISQITDYACTAVFAILPHLPVTVINSIREKLLKKIITVDKGQYSEGRKFANQEFRSEEKDNHYGLGPGSTIFNLFLQVNAYLSHQTSCLPIINYLNQSNKRAGSIRVRGRYGFTKEVLSYLSVCIDSQPLAPTHDDLNLIVKTLLGEPAESEEYVNKLNGQSNKSKLQLAFYNYNNTRNFQSDEIKPSIHYTSAILETLIKTCFYNNTHDGFSLALQIFDNYLKIKEVLNCISLRFPISTKLTKKPAIAILEKLLKKSPYNSNSTLARLNNYYNKLVLLYAQALSRHASTSVFTYLNKIIKNRKHKFNLAAKHLLPQLIIPNTVSSNIRYQVLQELAKDKNEHITPFFLSTLNAIRPQLPSKQFRPLLKLASTLITSKNEDVQSALLNYYPLFINSHLTKENEVIKRLESIIESEGIDLAADSIEFYLELHKDKLTTEKREFVLHNLLDVSLEMLKESINCSGSRRKKLEANLLKLEDTLIKLLKSQDKTFVSPWITKVMLNFFSFFHQASHPDFCKYFDPRHSPFLAKLLKVANHQDTIINLIRTLLETYSDNLYRDIYASTQHIYSAFMRLAVDKRFDTSALWKESLNIVKTHRRKEYSTFFGESPEKAFQWIIKTILLHTQDTTLITLLDDAITEKDLLAFKMIITNVDLDNVKTSHLKHFRHHLQQDDTLAKSRLLIKLMSQSNNDRSSKRVLIESGDFQKIKALFSNCSPTSQKIIFTQCINYFEENCTSKYTNAIGTEQRFDVASNTFEFIAAFYPITALGQRLHLLTLLKNSFPVSDSTMHKEITKIADKMLCALYPHLSDVDKKELAVFLFDPQNDFFNRYTEIQVFKHFRGIETKLIVNVLNAPSHPSLELVLKTIVRTRSMPKHFFSNVVDALLNRIAKQPLRSGKELSALRGLCRENSFSLMPKHIEQFIGIYHEQDTKLFYQGCHPDVLMAIKAMFELSKTKVDDIIAQKALVLFTKLYNNRKGLGRRVDPALVMLIAKHPSLPYAQLQKLDTPVTFFDTFGLFATIRSKFANETKPSKNFTASSYNPAKRVKFTKMGL